MQHDVIQMNWTRTSQSLVVHMLAGAYESEIFGRHQVV